MDSGNTPPPSPPSPVKQTIDQEQPQVNTTVDAPVFGGPIGNPIAAEIHGQPLSYNYVQPPSIGSIRPGVVSQPSGSNQPYSGGQPPSLNDMNRRDTSQTGGVPTGGEASEVYAIPGMSLTGGNFRRFNPDGK